MTDISEEMRRAIAKARAFRAVASVNCPCRYCKEASVIVDLANAIESQQAEIAALKRETEEMASESIRAHVEYKDRRNKQFAAYELAHKATIAFLIDRAEQYTNSSGYRAFIEELIDDLAIHRHVTNAEHGEYDDLMPRVEKIIKTRVATLRRPTTGVGR